MHAVLNFIHAFITQIITDPSIAIAVFSCAAMHEIFCVGFVHFTEHNNARMTGAVTFCAGTVTVVGWIGALTNNIYLPCLVLGWTFGAQLGVKIKIWKEKRNERQKRVH